MVQSDHASFCSHSPLVLLHPLPFSHLSLILPANTFSSSSSSSSSITWLNLNSLLPSFHFSFTPLFLSSFFPPYLSVPLSSHSGTCLRAFIGPPCPPCYIISSCWCSVIKHRIKPHRAGRPSDIQHAAVLTECNYICLADKVTTGAFTWHRSTVYIFY